MGLRDWIRGRKAGGTTTTTAVKTAAAVDVDPRAMVATGGDPFLGDPSQEEALLEQIDHFAHEIMTAGSAAGTTSVNVSSGTTVIVNGQTVDPADPRAREAIRDAAAKLRAQGLDEVAADLERQLGAAAPPAGFGASAAAGIGASAAGGAVASAAPGSAPEATAASETGLAPDDDAPSAPSPPSPPVAI